MDQVKKIKEKMCKVAQDFDAELKSATEHTQQGRTYKLPGDISLPIKEEQIKCTELLFQPVLAGKMIDGIHKFTHDSIIKCDNDIRRDLFKNIVLAGGCTMFDGMQARMKKRNPGFSSIPNGTRG